MGVIDEIRSHTPGNSSGSSSGSSGFDSDKFDDSFSSDGSSSRSLDPDTGSGPNQKEVGRGSSQSGKGGNRRGNQSRTGNSSQRGRSSQSSSSSQRQQSGSRNQSQRSGSISQGQQSGSRNQSQRSGSISQGQQSGRGAGGELPNAQAGRPQKGSSKPQLSSQTQKKMQNAGMDVNEGKNQRSNSGKQPQSVAESRDGIEELKSQNEQIIELLKRINQNLQSRG